MKCLKTLQAAVVLVITFDPAMAQQKAPTSDSTMQMRSGVPMTELATNATASPAATAFKAVDDDMMKAMDRPMTGNADQDFVAGMLPHHAGAVAMAKVELQYGKDPQMLSLARNIIAAQEKEIAQMQGWQTRHPEH